LNNTGVQKIENNPLEEKMKPFRQPIKDAIISSVATALIIGSSAVTAAGVLNVTNWAEYIAEDTISNFEKEYDVKVTYDVYDSSEAIEAKLMAGSSGYDVVSYSSSDAGLIIPAGILRKLDKSKIPNLKHMSPEVMEKLSSNWDPGNQYIVPFMWGTHGVTYNAELVKKTYPAAPIGSLDLIFLPEHMEQIAKCGVSFLDSPGDVIPMALAYLGMDPDSTNKNDYKEVAVLLKKIRPYIKTFDNYAYQRMPTREFCVSVTWGPDGLLAMSGAEEANTGVVLDFFLPPGQGAAQLWVDGWVIPADAENLENAHLFLNYLSRPEVGAADTNFTWYATANKDALSLIDDEVKNSPAAFPPPDQVAMMYTLKTLPPKIERLLTRTWTNIKSGN